MLAVGMMSAYVDCMNMLPSTLPLPPHGVAEALASLTSGERDDVDAAAFADRLTALIRAGEDYAREVKAAAVSISAKIRPPLEGDVQDALDEMLDRILSGERAFRRDCDASRQMLDNFRRLLGVHYPSRARLAGELLDGLGRQAATILEALRDARWEIMAARAAALPPTRGPLLTTADGVAAALGELTR